MKTTADFLDDLQKKLGVESDYGVGKAMGIHRQQLSHYRLLKGSFDDSMSMRVADILSLDPGYVVACMHHQRAKQPEVKKLWADMAEHLGGIAAAVLIVLALPFFGSEIMTSGLHAAPVGFVYYVKSPLALLWIWIPLLYLVLNQPSGKTGLPS